MADGEGSSAGNGFQHPGAGAHVVHSDKISEMYCTQLLVQYGGVLVLLAKY